MLRTWSCGSWIALGISAPGPEAACSTIVTTVSVPRGSRLISTWAVPAGQPRARSSSRRCSSASSERAQSALVEAARALFARLPADRRPPATMVAHHIWAMSHGVVELFGRGRPGARSPASADEMLESGALIYLRGLGVIPD